MERGEHLDVQVMDDGSVVSKTYRPAVVEETDRLAEGPPEAQWAGVGPRIHHWGIEVADKPAFADAIKQHGGTILSKPNEGALKFRAPDGTLAEIVGRGRYEKAKAKHA